MRVALGAALGGMLLAACAGPQIPRPTTAQAQASGVSLDELESGRTTYLRRCTVCHEPVPPDRFTRAEWPGHVAEMRERAKVSDDEARLIETYVTTMARP